MASMAASRFRLVDNMTSSSGRRRKSFSAAREKLEALGREILADAQRNCPVRTGRLRASGHSEVDADGILNIGFTAHYASYVHDGTSRQAPNPFLRNAIYKPRTIR